jgi:hypothetical protein
MMHHLLFDFVGSISWKNAITDLNYEGANGTSQRQTLIQPSPSQAPKYAGEDKPPDLTPNG